MSFFELAVANLRDQYGRPRPVQPDMAGPRECCANFAVVSECDGDTDTWLCPFGHSWQAPCPRPTV